MTKELETLYCLYLLWNPYNNKAFKGYCAEVLCNMFGFNVPLSVKLVYEAIDKTRSLLYSSRNVDELVGYRNKLLALDIKCVISKTEIAIGNEEWQNRKPR